MKVILRPVLPMIFMTLPISLGVFIMYYSTIPSRIWVLNIAIFLISSMLSFIILKRIKVPKPNSYVTIAVCVMLLILTFADSGLSGVHRWISIGPINVHISSIVLPILLIELGKNLSFKNWWSTGLLILGVTIVLSFQPDASTTIAFTFASFIILFKFITKTIQYLVLCLPLIISILTWVHLDNLPPVPYVEEILLMAKNIGQIPFIVGVLSLVLMPLPFFIFTSKTYKPIFISLGVYFSLIILSTLFGNFPVPLLGYGISPIIGYSIAITWLVKNYD